MHAAWQSEKQREKETERRAEAESEEDIKGTETQGEVGQREKDRYMAMERRKEEKDSLHGI